MPTTDWEPKNTGIDGRLQSALVARNIRVKPPGCRIVAHERDGRNSHGVFYDRNESKTITVQCVDKDGNPIERIEQTPVFSKDSFTDR